MSSPRAVPDEIMKNTMANKEEEEEEEKSSGEESSDDDSKSDDGSSVDDSSASYASSDSSLGNIIAEMGMSVPLGITSTKRPDTKRSKSTNNLLTMKLEADIDPSAIENVDQRAALEKFMGRMNNAENYFQKPKAKPTKTMPRKANSSGALDDILKDAENQNNPANLFEEMIEEVLPRTKRELLFTESYWKKYFLPISEKRKKAYTKEAVDAVRDQDLETLERILAKEGDSSMEAANAQVWIFLADVLTTHTDICMYFLTSLDYSHMHVIDFLTHLIPPSLFVAD